MASEGPGNWWQKTPQGLKGRNKTAAHSDAKSRPFRAEKILFANIDLGLRALRFTPGCHITGLQPGKCPNCRHGRPARENRATDTRARRPCHYPPAFRRPEPAKAGTPTGSQQVG